VVWRRGALQRKCMCARQLALSSRKGGSRYAEVGRGAPGFCFCEVGRGAPGFCFCEVGRGAPGFFFCEVGRGAPGFFVPVRQHWSCFTRDSPDSTLIRFDT
jgi:hypothetical protein